MKPLIWIIMVILFLLASCSPSNQAGNLPYPPVQQTGQAETPAYPAPQAAAQTSDQGYPAPPSTPEPVSWEEAKSAILEGKVIEAIQLHSLTVYLVLADGTRLMTDEPESDAVLAVIEECGPPCEKIEVITE